MSILGIRRVEGVAVAALSDDGAQVTGLAPLEQSWADVVEDDRLGVLRTTAVEKGARHGR